MPIRCRFVPPEPPGISHPAAHLAPSKEVLSERRQLFRELAARSREAEARFPTCRKGIFFAKNGGGLVREIPPKCRENSGLGMIVICQEYRLRVAKTMGKKVGRRHNVYCISSLSAVSQCLGWTQYVGDYTLWYCSVKRQAKVHMELPY